MPDTSPNLALPYLLPAQAQKHVTHNEALARLDLLVQLVVAGFDALTPPASPAAGDIHALGAVPLGDWAGQGGRLAVWDGAAWGFITPRTGWRAWGLTESALRIWRGTAWESLPFDNLDGLGVGTAHDATNRLAVAAPATLLTHAGAGHQVKVNKAAMADTASLLFQSNWAGRAEMGLAGNDDFSIKVSPDGGSWFDALVADRNTGRLRLPGGARLANGSAASPALAFDASPATGLFRPAADQIGFSVGGVQRALLSSAALQLDVALTGAAVTQSASDATAGRVLKVGDGGLLGLAIGYGSGTTWGAPTFTQFIAAPNVSGQPSDKPVGAGMVGISMSSSATRGAQVVIDTTSSGAAGRTYLRTWNGGSPGTWLQLYSQLSAVGTVSQSGGAPTGAIIERGSNANGDYVRFADGTQTCTRTVTANTAIATAFLGGFRSAGINWTFPAAFSAAPAVSGAGLAGTTMAPIFDAPAATAVNWNAVAFTSQAAADRTVTLMAYGRWF